MEIIHITNHNIRKYPAITNCGSNGRKKRVNKYETRNEERNVPRRKVVEEKKLRKEKRNEHRDSSSFLFKTLTSEDHLEEISRKLNWIISPSQVKRNFTRNFRKFKFTENVRKLKNI